MPSNKHPKLLCELFYPLLRSKKITINEIERPNNEDLILKWSKHYLVSNLKNNEALWHTFSHNHCNHYFGQLAIEKFEQSYIKDFFIFSTNEFHALECLSSNLVHISFSELFRLVGQSSCFIDIFVSHKNFNWTFVIPHEVDFGPYFAKSILHYR